MTKFYTLYKKPGTVTYKPDLETKFVDQSEADRASLKYQLERYGMDSLLQQFEKTKAQFGYADTRLTKSFEELQNKMAEANSYFMELPSQIRKRFNHNATEFYTFIEQNPTMAYKEGYISERLANDLGVVTQPVATDEIKTTTIETPTQENSQVSAIIDK